VRVERVKYQLDPVAQVLDIARGAEVLRFRVWELGYGSGCRGYLGVAKCAQCLGFGVCVFDFFFNFMF